MAATTVLVNFNGTNGATPVAGLTSDANGNLFSTTSAGGADGDGTVFELVRTAAGYASTPTTLVSFSGANGSLPRGNLSFDANGNLLSTTFIGGATNDGTVFEIPKTPDGYATTPTTLASFQAFFGPALGASEPLGGLFADGSGNLLGTTRFGGGGDLGTVFEIAKTADGYASTPTALFAFGLDNGEAPQGSLIADANGDLFGTTSSGGGGSPDRGTVFEIPKTEAGYANAPTTLVSFDGTNGGSPLGDLLADASGDLFGTTSTGGSGNLGTVFEIAKTADGYASTPTTLVSFDGTIGANPDGSLIADADGNLFGTTSTGGENGKGTVFEIAKTADGYASTPTTLVSFDGTDGANPKGDLFADANGTLFGTASAGGAGNNGTVFEITGSGFVAPPAPLTLVQQTLTYTVAEGQTLQGLYDALLSNVSTADNVKLTLTSAGKSSTAGFLSFDPNAQQLTYTADGYNAGRPTDSFTYTASDPQGDTVTGTVDISITGANLPGQDGAPGADALAANGSGQRIIGSDGNDNISGNGGRQFIFGGRGDDTIIANGSRDMIYGGPGTNTISFHGGHETVVLQQGGLDQILGFGLHNHDQIDLSQVLAEAQVDLGGDMAKLGSYVQVTTSGSDAALSFNPDGIASGPGAVLAVLHGVGPNTTLDTLVNDGAVRIT